jgi:hypothetical protein
MAAGLLPDRPSPTVIRRIADVVAMAQRRK